MDPDYHEIKKLQKNLLAARAKIGTIAKKLGEARTVKELFKRDLDDTLAAAQLRFIQRGEGMAASLAMARTDPQYLEKKKTLVNGLRSANDTLSEWEALQGAIDIGRSLLAVERASFNLGG